LCCRCAPNAQNAPSPSGAKPQVKQMLDGRLRRIKEKDNMPVFLPFWKTNSKKAEGIALLLAGLFFTIISILYSVNDLVFFSNADKFNAIVIENIERINSDKQVEYIIKVRFFDHNKTEKIKILKEKSLTEPQFMINEKIIYIIGIILNP